MPTLVCDALSKLHQAGRPGGVDYLDGDQALSVVQAAEVAKAWVESVSLAATAQMVYRVEASMVTSSRYWTSIMDPDGTVHWTTALGRT